MLRVTNMNGATELPHLNCWYCISPHDSHLCYILEFLRDDKQDTSVHVTMEGSVSYLINSGLNADYHMRVVGQTIFT